jgi:hypothetical protein
VGLKLNGIHQLLIYADEVGLEVNTETAKYILRHQNPGQNHDIKTANRSFQNVSQFRYLGITATNEKFIQEDILRRLISGNACYHSVQSFCLLVCCLKT